MKPNLLKPIVAALAVALGSAAFAAPTYQLRQHVAGLSALGVSTQATSAPPPPSAVGDGTSKAGACASGAVGCATWAGSLYDLNRVLSADGLTVSSSAGTINTSSTVGKSVGKWYFEVTTPAQGITLGVCRVDLGSYSPHGVNCYGGDGYWWYSSGNSSRTNMSWYGMSVLSVQLDLDSHTATFLRNNSAFKTVSLPPGTWTPVINGSAQSNPAVFPAVGNFGQSNFQYPVPAGYNAGLW